jgi:hypothetical protein
VLNPVKPSLLRENPPALGPGVSGANMNQLSFHPDYTFKPTGVSEKSLSAILFRLQLKRKFKMIIFTTVTGAKASNWRSINGGFRAGPWGEYYEKD